jgi:hypothetical protein
MDNQFHTLTKSYIDNYVEYAKTGTESYKTAYESAEQGIQTILGGLNKTQPEPIDLQAQKDELKAAEMRQSNTSFSSGHTTQYVVLGLLSAAVIGLFMI